MPHVAPIERATLPEFNLVFDETQKVLGTVPNSMLTMSHKPGIAGAFALLTGAVFHQMGATVSFKTLCFFAKFMREARRRDPENEITPELAQLIGHTSSLAAGCRYCQAHTGNSAALLDVSPEKIADIPKYDTSPHFDPAERAALALAFAAAKVPNESNGEHFAKLRKHFNEKQIVEIVSVISLFGFLNRWNDTMATALEDPPKHFAESTLAANGWTAEKHEQ